MRAIWTIGYQGRKLAELGDVLLAAGVTRVIDVRQRAWSYRPEFRKAAVANLLASLDIEYRHCPAAGNPFRKTASSTAECWRLYRQHLKTAEVLDAVTSEMKDSKPALLCYEAESTDCHRNLIVQALRKRHPSLKVHSL